MHRISADTSEFLLIDETDFEIVRSVCARLLFYILATVVLTVLSRIFIWNTWNVYTLRTQCEIVSYHYERGVCDLDDGDSGMYDHTIRFKQECNQQTYEIEEECSGFWGYSHQTGDIHSCWTNVGCSTQALFDDDIGLFIRRWGISSIGYVCVLLAVSNIIDFVSLAIKICSDRRLYATMREMWSPKRLDSVDFMNGYFRRLQSDPQCRGLVVPMDIELLCRACILHQQQVSDRYRDQTY